MAEHESMQVNELVTPTGQRITFGIAAPTSQPRRSGDIVINTAPTLNGTFAWQCTTAGSPGTWSIISNGTPVGVPTLPVATVAALGTNTQASAAPITYGFTAVTGANATLAVVLPVAAAGKQVIIKNVGAAALPVFPAGANVINALAPSASLVLAASVTVTLVAVDAVTWYSLPLLPS